MPAPEGPQFRFYRQTTEVDPYSYTTNHWHNPEFDVVNYGPQYEDTYTYRSEADNQVHSIAGVTHYPNVSIQTYPDNYTHDDAWAKSKADVGETIPLFMHTEIPGHSEVGYWAGTKGARIASMLMMGMADVATRTEHGRGLTPDSSLSRHSKRIVQKAAQAGVTKMPAFVSNNSIDFWRQSLPKDHFRELETGTDNPVPPSLVKAGKERIREVLSKEKGKSDELPKKVLGYKGRQLKLSLGITDD